MTAHTPLRYDDKYTNGRFHVAAEQRNFKRKFNTFLPTR